MDQQQAQCLGILSHSDSNELEDKIDDMFVKKTFSGKCEPVHVNIDG